MQNLWWWLYFGWKWDVSRKNYYGDEKDGIPKNVSVLKTIIIIAWIHILDVRKQVMKIA